MNDVTENQQPEFPSEAEKLVITDLEYRMVMISDAMMQVLGYQSESQVLGDHFLRKIVRDPLDRDIIEKSLKKFSTLSWYPACLSRSDGGSVDGDIRVLSRKNRQRLIGYEFHFKSAGAAWAEPSASVPETDDFIIDETSVPFLAGLEDEEPAGAPAGEERKREDIVLIIDDDPAIIDVDATVLTFRGFKTYSTKSLQEGLQLLDRLKQDIKVILLDFSLIELIGEENIYKIIEISPASALVLSSGYPADLFKELLQKSGAAWLQKPYSSEQLVQAVASKIDAMKNKDEQTPKE